MLVLGVEEDPLGVGIDVCSRRDEQCCDVSLPPLDGDVQRRLPCGWGGMGWDGVGRRSAAGTSGDKPCLAFSPFWPAYPPRNHGEITAAWFVSPATKSPNFILCFVYSCMEARNVYGVLALSFSVRDTAHTGRSFDCCPQEAHSLTEN